MKTPIDEKELLKFGNNLKRLRKEQGLTQRELARKSNVDDSKIAKIENGKINITLTTLLAFAKGLKVHPPDLLDYP